jgi:hypothetical protein
MGIQASQRNDYEYFQALSVALSVGRVLKKANWKSKQKSRKPITKNELNFV